jgi:two-component system sensor histidine kinase KdpD
MSPVGVVRHKSFADLLALACPEVDVIRLAASTHVEVRVTAAQPELLAPAEVAATLAVSWPGYCWAAVYCGVAVAVSMLAFTVLHQTNIVMLFLLAVVVVALRHGRGPAAFASVLAVAAFDFFFVTPLRSFAVSDVQYLVTFFVMLGVGLLIGQLTAGLRSQAITSVQRENHARALYEFARELSSSLLPEQIVASAGSFVRASFQSRCALFIMDDDNKVQAAITDVDNLPPPDAALAQWVCDHGQPAGSGTDTLSASAWLYLPLKAPMRTRGVLAVESSRQPTLAQLDVRRQLDACATLIAIALERLHYVDIAQKALISMESEKLRGSLLAAISHDLRTPLTSLVGMADNLLHGEPALPPERHEIVAAMRAQALRMRTMVVNLLDMARLQSRAVPVRMEWQSVEELVGAALADMRDALGGHQVTVAPLSSLPLVECDGVLIERVLCNLLENASKFAPTGTRVHIAAQVDGAELHVSVADDGPGVLAGSERAIFEKFTRGERESATTGVGLGLAICEAIIGIHHGRIWVETAAPDYAGARFVFTLPLGVEPTPYPEPFA